MFAGYDRNDADEDRFVAGLPEEYKPIARSRYFYNEGVEKSLLGLNYTYDYNVRYAGADQEEAFFGFLLGEGEARAAHRLPEALQRQLAQVFCNPADGEPQPCQKGACAT